MPEARALLAELSALPSVVTMLQALGATIPICDLQGARPGRDNTRELTGVDCRQGPAWVQIHLCHWALV